jgi:multiple sugar transport system ATP-binding protein
MARVTLEHVEKTFPGGTRALADCSLDVADGELVVLVGPSGCGKSTLLRLVAGLEEATAGTIRIDDQDATHVPPQARNVAMVFQDYALYPHMTARENLAFPLEMHRVTHQERDTRVARVAESLGLTPLLERLPKALSGGQRQRVAMGRALVREPAVFLMDEPLSNLDARLRTQVRAEIKELQRRTRTTTLYVTHDQVEAMTLGDRVAVLNAGVLQQVAPPRELYDWPVNPFVAGFIGNPPMNLFPSRLDQVDGRFVLVVGDQVMAAGDVADMPRRVPLTAGVRPEHVAIVGDGDDTLRATVAHVELLGHETLVYADVGNVRLVARTAGMSDLAAGEHVFLRLDSARVHVWERDKSDEARP